jgi:hypothetical protein
MMLIALLLAYLGSLLLGGAGVVLFSGESRDRVETVLVEKAKVKAVLADMDAMEDAASDVREGLTKELKAWAKKDRDHSTGREALTQVSEKFTAQRAEARGKLLDALFAMRSKLTAQQWNAVFREEKSDRGTGRSHTEETGR